MNQTHAKHLYIHIPFCHRRCAYCDFNTYANMEDRMAAYVEALCRELADLRATWGIGQEPPYAPDSSSAGLVRAQLRPTVFLGGGTPSMLPLELMARVLAAADTVVPLATAEVTVEANPGTVLGRDYLRSLRDLGVNRLSMGVQSLHDPTLRVLGRIHSAAEAYTSFEDARAAGFDNLNLDFMFGLPGQTLAQWEQSLDVITSWGADHFSLYSLILEETTPLFAQVQGGRVSVPDDDATAAMYEAAIERLAAAGYTQYEISNWARPAVGQAVNNTAAPSPLALKACHHNLAYWLNADYLAAGAGAHGHVFPRRYHDILGIDAYIAAADQGQAPTAEVITLAADDLAAETMFMGLRLNVGVSYSHFRERTGRALRSVYGSVLERLIAQELLLEDDQGVRLSDHGRMLGNRVFAEFV